VTTDPVVKKLRENATDAERKLWHHLRRKQINDLRFRRQYRIGSYVVDLICLPARLVVEVDGGQHDVRRAEDDARTAWLESQGFRVIRFWNNEVLGNIEGVLHVVGEQLAAPPPPPTPSREGRG
jgi:very-short-patch-repair endonuclease